MVDTKNKLAKLSKQQLAVQRKLEEQGKTFKDETLTLRESNKLLKEEIAKKVDEYCVLSLSLSFYLLHTCSNLITVDLSLSHRWRSLFSFTRN